jgi:hypothetical protein
VVSWYVGGLPDAAWFACWTSEANTSWTTPAVTWSAIE